MFEAILSKIVRTRHIYNETDANRMMKILEDRLHYGPGDNVLNSEINLEWRQTQTYFFIVQRYLCFFLNRIGLTSDIPPHPSKILFPGDATTSDTQISPYLINNTTIQPSWIEGLNFGEIQELTPKITQADELHESEFHLNIQIGAHTDQWLF